MRPQWKGALVALFVAASGCNHAGDAPSVAHHALAGAVAPEDYGGCYASDWTADDIPEDYYNWQATIDSTGATMGPSGPWTLTVGPPPQSVEVAPPISTPAMHQGSDWDIRLNASGQCELVFYTAAPYTVRVGGASVFIAGAAAAALSDGQPVRMRRAQRGTGIIPGDADLSLYSDAAPGLIALGGAAVPLGQLALPQPKMEVNDAAGAVTAINNRARALGRPIVVAFLAHGNVGLVALKNENITPDNGLAKFIGARGNVSYQAQISCLAGTPATPQVLETIADAYTSAAVAEVGGWDAVIVATPFGFFTTGSYHVYHGE